uniref:Uncharacterized protein n=1 Tax=uncultured Bacillota bacterium TaxID=344338 RepID=A0A650F4Z7_9FIRM|nr:hypothetical protein Firmicute1046_3110 [uncultured Firmicutes bacterium]
MLQLYLFRELNQDKIIQALLRFQESGSIEDYFTAAGGLLEFSQKRAVTERTISEYVLQTMLHSRQLLNLSGLEKYLKHDIDEICKYLLFYDWDALCQKCNVLPIASIAPQKDIDTGLNSFIRSLRELVRSRSVSEITGALIAHCEKFGTGKTSAYAALRWANGKLEGIRNTDTITFADLTGLKYQKQVLIDNTEAFVSGKSANNVLLAGDSGTGKSSSVKACLNMFKDRGLRLIEVGKEDLTDLPQIMEQVKNRNLKYIIFVDDLSFESSDVSYKQLKSALDGQVEQRPDNVLIYATSNRRHLIKETWSEREGADGDDIHRSDTLNEKRSLSERFGINLFFLSPDQEEYINIVATILSAQGVEMDEEIRRQALAWAVNYHGRSGRTAKQFASDYLSKMV